MVKIRRIIQLLLSGASERSISAQLHVNRETVRKYRNCIGDKQLDDARVLAMSDDELHQLVYIPPEPIKPDNRHNELKNYFPYFQTEIKSPGVTLKTLWEEYKEAHPEGYGYSQFCYHISEHERISKATMCLTHRCGDVLQVDFAGKNLSIVNRNTGEITECPVLICVLPFSGKTYVEALPTAGQEHLFNALSRCLRYFGGVTSNVLSDNMRQVVTRNGRYEFTFTDMAEQWSAHYNTNLIATRPGKPKDKPSVENGVRLSYMRVYAKLRHEEFYSVVSLNKRIQELLEQLNGKHFQGKGISRQDKFILEEKERLKPLPDEDFLVRHITTGKVQMNYHVIVGEDKHQYSVPYQYIGKQTRIIYDQWNVEIYIGMERIAIHRRSYQAYGHTTLPEHMPPRHLKYKETQGWDAEYFMKYAKEIGPFSEIIFSRMLASKDLIEQTYNACIGLKRLACKCGNERFELACKRASEASRISYGLIKNILENKLDTKVDQQLDLFITPSHENIRGPQAYY
jgi:transposase